MKLSILCAVLVVLMSSGVVSAGERFACNVKGLTSAERERYRLLTEMVLKAIVEKVELPNGYGFRLNRSQFSIAAEWISLETKCCPFFTFQLELEKNEGPLWLRLTGSDGVKGFIRAEFQL